MEKSVSVSSGKCAKIKCANCVMAKGEVSANVQGVPGSGIEHFHVSLTYY